MKEYTKILADYAAGLKYEELPADVVEQAKKIILHPIAGRIAACLTKNGLPTGTAYPPQALAEAALADKKRAGGEITLVIPRRIGNCGLRKMPVEDLLPVIQAGWEA